MATNQNKEFNSTLVDLKILSNLALYHSRRIPAAIYYCLFLRTHDPAALDSAMAHEQKAIDAWKQIVSAAGDMYADNLAMGLGKTQNEGDRMELTGHWKDELASLEKGLLLLKDKRRQLTADSMIMHSPALKPVVKSALLTIDHKAITNFAVGKPMPISANITAPAGVKWVRLRYRGVNQQQDYQVLEMKEIDQKGNYSVVVPADQIDPEWDFMYFIEIMDNEGNGAIYPDFNKETPYVVVKLTR